MSLHCVVTESGCAAIIRILHINLTYNSLYYVTDEDLDVTFNYPLKVLPFQIDIKYLRQLNIYRKCQGQ